MAYFSRRLLARFLRGKVAYFLRRSTPAPKAVRKYQENVRALTLRHDRRPLEKVVKRVIRTVRGWSQYYRLCGKSPVLWQLGKWTEDRLRTYKVGGRWRGAW